MIKLELADYWDLYGLRDMEWKSTDFANEFADCKFEGYSVINVDAGGVGYDIIGEDTVTYSVPTNYENVALRPSMKYSYVKEFCEDVKDLGNGYYEVTFGEYPKSKINEKIDGEKLVRTGKEFTVKQNGKFVKLYELVDELGNKMVVVNGNFYKVEPLVWVVSSYKDIMITKDAINGGFAYENALTEEEEAYAACIDRLMQRKMSQRSIMIAEKSRNDNTLANNFLRNIMSNEIINEEMINKIRERNKEQARKEAEEKARLEAIKKEKRRLQYEKNKEKRRRRQLLDYYFPRTPISAMLGRNFDEESLVVLNQLISEELPKVKHYVNNKEQVIDLIIYLYKCVDGKERRMPYPEERYDACRCFLEEFDLDYLNIVLKETIGRDKLTEDHIEYLINNSIAYKLTK